MEYLHNKIVVAYLEYKASEFEKKYKTKYQKTKSDFRKKKRQNIDTRKEKRSKSLSNLYKMDRAKFWRNINRMQTKDIRVEAKLEDIKTEYAKFFTKHNEVKHDQTEKIFRKVEAFIKIYKNTNFKFEINVDTIKKLINDLPKGKSIGFSNVSNEMLKYSNNVKLYLLISTLFTKMIEIKTNPYKFNVSILKPIIKDQNKPFHDLKNLRPIAISDAIANLYESVLLEKLSIEHTDHAKQFGFKKSCSNAIFSLKQAIKICKKKQKEAIRNSHRRIQGV